MLLFQTKKELVHKLSGSLSLAFAVELEHFNAVLFRFPACQAENLLKIAIQIVHLTQLFDFFLAGLTQKVHLTPDIALIFGGRNVEEQLGAIFERESVVEKLAGEWSINELNKLFGWNSQTQFGVHDRLIG